MRALVVCSLVVLEAVVVVLRGGAVVEDDLVVVVVVAVVRVPSLKCECGGEETVTVFVCPPQPASKLLPQITKAMVVNTP